MIALSYRYSDAIQTLDSESSLSQIQPISLPSDQNIPAEFPFLFH